MDKKTPIFVRGLIWKRPDEQTKVKAPWVKGKMSINVPSLREWLDKYEQGEWLNLDLKESKDKKTLYFELNTYGRKEVEQTPPTPTITESEAGYYQGDDTTEVQFNDL